jgi:hypothetical protein
MTRQEANKEILKILEDYVNKYPDWRFGQILVNSNVVTVIHTSNGSVCYDLFYEESKVTLERAIK